MSDLFISYSSHDRPWAERLYKDIRINYPFCQIFWDQESIMVAANWREVLEKEKREAAYLAVFWSEKAKESNEVGPEIDAFLANQGSPEKVFYIPLEGARGPQEQNQGFPAFKLLYKPAADTPDRGVSGINADPSRTEWNRMIRKIGDAIQKGKKTQPIRLAVLCTYKANVKELEKVLDDHPRPYASTLRELLDGINIKFEDVKDRYGETTFGWRPFGTNRTVEEIMEDLRMQINSQLDPKYHFHWEPVHLVPNTQDDADRLNRLEFEKRVKSLAETPSIVLIDPISLYENNVRGVFDALDTYKRREESVLVWLSPLDSEPTLDWVYKYLYEANRLVEDYFQPQIPSVGSFPRCGVSLHHPFDLTRLIRGSLGSYFQKDKNVDKTMRGVGA